MLIPSLLSRNLLSTFYMLAITYFVIACSPTKTESTVRDCEAPPIALIGTDASFEANIIKVGEAKYHISPVVNKLMPDNTIDKIAAQYSLCQGIKNKLFDAGDLDAQAKYLRNLGYGN